MAANPASSGTIEVRLRESGQLFNTMDPAPFHDKDLDADAEEYVLGSARELPRDVVLTLVVYLDQPVRSAEEEEAIGKAVRAHFVRLSQSARQRLSRLFRRGRISLAIGLPCL